MKLDGKSPPLTSLLFEALVITTNTFLEGLSRVPRGGSPYGKVAIWPFKNFKMMGQGQGKVSLSSARVRVPSALRWVLNQMVI